METNGGLTTGQRLERIEDAVLRIETKLDTKVNRDLFDSAVARISIIENGETPLGKYMVQQFRDIQQQVGEIQLHGSQSAQTLTRQVGAQEQRLAELDKYTSAQRAAIHERQDTDTRRFRIWSIVLSLASASSVVLGTISLLATHH